MGIMAEAIKMEKRERAQIQRDKLKVKSLASIADSLETIAEAISSEDGWLVRAILEHATVMKQDVTRALNNVAYRPRKKK